MQGITPMRCKAQGMGVEKAIIMQVMASSIQLCFAKNDVGDVCVWLVCLNEISNEEVLVTALLHALVPLGVFSAVCFGIFYGRKEKK